MIALNLYLNRMDGLSRDCFRELTLGLRSCNRIQDVYLYHARL